MGEDDFAAYAFTVSIDGIVIPGVIEVSGVTSEVDTIETKEQTPDGRYVVRQLPGRPKPGEFTVTRGLTASRTVSDLLEVAMEGDVAGARKTASVELLDFEGRVVKSYRFHNCWIAAVEVSSPDPEPEAAAGAVAGTVPGREMFTVRFDESEVA